MSVKIVFPEITNQTIQDAIKLATEKYGTDFEPVGADNLENACLSVKNGIADAMVAGIDYTSREVILACRDIIGIKDQSAPRIHPISGRQLKKTFSACFLMTREQNSESEDEDLENFIDVPETYIVADAAACKHPTEDQLYDIVVQTHETATKLFKKNGETPRVAMLSFSTLGSGGDDESIMRIHQVLGRIKNNHPEIIIDGELQLDAAIDPIVAEKKAPASKVAGHANVLICPDLNSGNILYKAMERFGGFTAAGPILQGFNAPASDLSRGSTVSDVLSVIDAIMILSRSEND